MRNNNRPSLYHKQGELRDNFLLLLSFKIIWMFFSGIVRFSYKLLDNCFKCSFKDNCTYKVSTKVKGVTSKKSMRRNINYS